MTFNEYQKESRKFAVYKDQGNNYIYPLIGLAGETGEVAEKFKKLIRNDDSVITEEFRESVKKELGDVLWYIAQLCAELGITFDDVAKSNMEKIESRTERGVVKSSGDDR